MWRGGSIVLIYHFFFFLSSLTSGVSAWSCKVIGYWMDGKAFGSGLNEGYHGRRVVLDLHWDI